MNCGVYKISFEGSDNFYIGSTKNFNIRKKDHINCLKRSGHRNQILQRAFNKYGESNFKFEIISTCKIENLLKIEQLYINGLLPEYNISKIAGRTIKFKVSPEERINVINDHLSDKYTKNQLAIKYNVCSTTISGILYRYDNTISKENQVEINKRKNKSLLIKHNATLNTDIVANIKYFIQKEYTLSSISKYYNISARKLSSIKTERIYKLISPILNNDISKHLIKSIDIDYKNRTRKNNIKIKLITQDNKIIIYNTLTSCAKENKISINTIKAILNTDNLHKGYKFEN